MSDPEPRWIELRSDEQIKSDLEFQQMFDYCTRKTTVPKKLMMISTPTTADESRLYQGSFPPPSLEMIEARKLAQRYYAKATKENSVRVMKQIKREAEAMGISESTLKSELKNVARELRQ